MHAISKTLETLLLSISPPQDLIFLSDRMARRMDRETGGRLLKRHSVRVLPNCSDLGPLPRREVRNTNRRTLVMTGRTGWQKDYEFAAHLFSACPENYQLNLCGPGTETEAFQNRISAIVGKKAFSRITFSGPLGDVKQVLAAADAYLLTSRYEGTPIGALEAFEAGMPIILRNFDGAGDLTDKHPCSLLIGHQPAARTAAEVDALITRYDADAHQMRKDVKRVWQQNWSPGLFNQNARRLVRTILNQPQVAAGRKGYDRDAPTLHPDHRRNAAARVPVPPPYCKGGAPSAGNG